MINLSNVIVLLPFFSDIQQKVLGILSFYDALLSLENETSLAAEKQIWFTDYVFVNFRKAFTSVVVLVGDNCSTNRPAACKLRFLLIDCTRNWFNLVAKQLIVKDEDSSEECAYVNETAAHYFQV